MRYRSLALTGLLTAFPVGWLLWATAHYAINVPVEDDYQEIVDYWHQLHRLPLWPDGLRVLFEQYGFTEHRRVAMKLMAQAEVLLFGQFDMRRYSWLAVGWLVGLVALLAGVFRREVRQPAWAFAPVVWLLFQPQLMHRGILWACAASINHLVVLLGLLGAVAVAWRWRGGLWLAAGCGLVAPFVMSNGLFAAAALPALLLGQRRFRAAAVGGLLLAGLAAVYFHGYSSAFTPTRPPLGVALSRLLLLLGGYANFYTVGRPVQAIGLPVAVGLLTLAGWGLALAQAGVSFFRKNENPAPLPLFTAAFGGWLLLTVAGVSLTRGTGSAGDLLQNRYLIFPVAFACTVYLYALWRLPGRLRWGLAGATLGLAVALGLWHAYQAPYLLRPQHDMLRSGVFNKKQVDDWLIYPADNFTPAGYGHRGNRSSSMALAAGTYHLPASWPAARLAALPVAPARLHIRTDSTGYFIENEDIVLPEAGRVLLCWQHGDTLLLTPTQRRPGGHRQLLTALRWYLPTGFSAHVPARLLPPGRYAAGVLVVGPGSGLRRYASPDTLAFRPGPLPGRRN